MRDEIPVTKSIRIMHKSAGWWRQCAEEVYSGWCRGRHWDVRERRGVINADVGREDECSLSSSTSSHSSNTTYSPCCCCCRTGKTTGSVMSLLPTWQYLHWFEIPDSVVFVQPASSISASSRHLSPSRIWPDADTHVEILHKVNRYQFTPSIACDILLV